MIDPGENNYDNNQFAEQTCSLSFHVKGMSGMLFIGFNIQKYSVKFGEITLGHESYFPVWSMMQEGTYVSKRVCKSRYIYWDQVSH